MSVYPIGFLGGGVASAALSKQALCFMFPTLHTARGRKIMPKFISYNRKPQPLQNRSRSRYPET